MRKFGWAAAAMAAVGLAALGAWGQQRLYTYIIPSANDFVEIVRTPGNNQGLYSHISDLADSLASIGDGFLNRKATNATLPDARDNIIYTPHRCDGVHGGSMSTTSGSAAVHSTKVSFTAADVGKTMLIEAAGAAGATLVSPIASVQGPNDATLAAPASATLSSATFAYGSDYAAEIQAAIDAGITVNLPRGECGIASTLHIKDNTVINGHGSSAFFPPRSSLMWLSASASPMLDVSDATMVIVRAQLSGITLWGMCAASIGVDVKALQVSEWNQVQPINMLDSGFHFDISANQTKDNAENTLIRLAPGAQSACANNMRGLVVEPGTVAPGAHDFTRTTFIDFRATMRNGTGLDLYGINSSDFYNTRLFTSTGGKSMVLHAADNTPQHAHANYFFGLEAQGQIVSETGVVPAVNNFIVGYDVSTFAQNLDIQSNSTLYCRTTLAGANPNQCSPWLYYGTAMKMDNSAASATIYGESGDNGIRLSGGANDGSGGKVTVFGTTAGVPSSIYLDGDTVTLRDAGQANNTFIIRPNKGHISVGNTTAPTLTGCGTDPVINGTDIAGVVVWGTGGPTTCTITFNQAYTGAPYCVVTWQANLASTTYVVTNTDITLTQTATSSNKTHYICMSRNGG